MSGLFDNPSLALLVTEPQRERALAYLQGAYADGRLDELEFEDRVGQALAARTRGELNSAFRGLVHIRTSSAAVARVAPSNVARNVTSGLIHWSGLVSWIIGPAVIYGAADRGSVVRAEAGKALAFTSVMTLVALVGIVLPGAVATTLWILACTGFWAITTAAMGLRAISGRPASYPLLGRLTKSPETQRRQLR